MGVKQYGYVLLLATVMLCCAGCDKKNAIEVDVQTEVDNSDRKGKETTEDAGTKNQQEGTKIWFSETGYFYDKNIELELLSEKEGSIYYTMDGTDPNVEQKLYEKAINLKAGKEVKAVCIKAKAFYEDGTESDTIVHTYFVGEGVDTRFDTLVFSVTTDPYNLYDYEYGIFVEGKLREDYVKENPYKKIDPPAPANYNMRGRESEREVYLEILEPDGTGVVEQAAGIRTYGGWSRANLQKSIKIFARKDYDLENNKLRYKFFPTKLSANGDGKTPNAFKRLVLRNSGNDNGFGFIRDELFQTLASKADYLDYEAVRPATLFVNGEYRGVYWLHDVYCDEYFEENYGDYEGAFEILEGGEVYKSLDDDGENAKAVEDYDTMYNKYSEMDLTDNATFDKLCQEVDVENYLSYFALQAYIGNEDWPHNNYRTYRYYTSNGEEYREAPFDGKWRYLLHDLDYSFAIYGGGARIDNIYKYVGKNGEVQSECPLFGQLMKRADCKEIFLKQTLDLINGAFKPENLNATLEEMNTSRWNEQMNMYGKKLITDWVMPEMLEERMEEIMAYGAERAEYILTKYQQYFGMGEIYQLSVQPAEGCKVRINTFITEDYFYGSYYSDYSTVLTAMIPEGKEFDYWLVNEEKITEEELVVTPAMLDNLFAEIICVTK